MEGRLVLLAAVLMVFAAQGKASFLIVDNQAQVNVTASGCGTTKVCVDFPDDCEPAENQTCLFMSGIASPPTAAGDSNLTIELSGQSSGYIAVALVANASEADTAGFVCGRNPWDDDSFFFSTVEVNGTDDVITQTNMTVTDVQGSVEGNLIQCQFTIPVTTTNFSVLLGNGTIDMNLDLGPFYVDLVIGPLDFASPSSNNNATVAPTVTSHTPKGASGALQPQALLLLLSLLPLSVLQKA